MAYELPAAHDCDGNSLITAKAVTVVLNADFGSEHRFTSHHVHVLADFGLIARHVNGRAVRFCEDEIRRFAECGINPWDLILRRETKCPSCGAELGIGDCGEG